MASVSHTDLAHYLLFLLLLQSVSNATEQEDLEHEIAEAIAYPMRNTIARCLPWLIFGTCLLAQTPTIEQQKERWNKVFTGSDIPFNRRPNAFLLKSVQGKTPGTALEIGMGQGRNTIAMARLGWDVTGIDISDEGIRQAVAEAEKQNVSIHAILASADDFDYGGGRYDLIYASGSFGVFE